MTELERRALMGDRQAQKECTKEGIVLPCPMCGKESETIGRKSKGELAYQIRCENKKCLLHSIWKLHKSLIAALTDWNARPTPPIGKCGECVNKYSSEFCECRKDDDFCSDFKPRGYTKNM